MDTPDAQLEAALAPLLDLDRFLTNYAVEMVAALWDNYAIVAWNFYLYHPPGGRFVLLTHGVNWPYWHADMDPFDIHTDPWGTGGSAPPGYLCDRVDRVPALAARFRAELVAACAVIAALAVAASGGSGLAVLGVAAAIAVVLGLALEMGEGELAADSLAVAAAAVELAVAVGFAAVAPAVRSPFVG